MTRTEQKIVSEVGATGCLPKHADYRTVRRMKDSGLIYFDGKRYRLGKRPSQGQRAFEIAMGVHGYSGSAAEREDRRS